MKKKVIIAHDYKEGSAATNRIYCFAKGYVAQGLDVVLLLFNPIGEVEPPECFCVTKCFLEPSIPFRISRRLIAVCQYVKAIKKEYIPGRTVIHIYRTPWWGFLFNKKKYYFFFERGEIPFFTNSRSFLYRIQEYLGIKVAKRSTGMLAQTYSLKDYYTEQGVKNIEVVNMFVDTERFKGPFPKNNDKYIAYCGTISKQKDGVDYLIKAFALLRKQFNEYRLYLIGDFDALYNDKQCIVDLIDSLGLSDSIVITGRVKPGVVPVLLSNAEMLTMARPVNKQTQYGFPTKLGEYLCTGNPVVLTDVGEVGLYLKDLVNCVFAKPESVEDLAEKMCWVLSHKEEARRIGMEGRKLVDSEFSIFPQTKKAVEFMFRTAGIGE